MTREEKKQREYDLGLLYVKYQRLMTQVQEEMARLHQEIQADPATETELTTIQASFEQPTPTPTPVEQVPA